MPTITRGHNYGINDFVNAADLNELVSRAQITGLTVADLGSGIAIMSSFSAPTDAAVGWITAKYEVPRLTFGASFAEYIYTIKVDSQANPDVALFKPLGLESGRFCSTVRPQEPGNALFIRVDASNGVTLSLTHGYTTGTPQHAWLGANIGTAATAAGTNRTRLVIGGFFGSRVVDAGDTIRKYYYMLNAVTGQWQHSPGATNVDKVGALSMNQSRNDAEMPAWMFSAPIWRA
jgi:hypothetical protein